MASIIEVLLALLRSHRESVFGEVKGLAIWGALLAAFAGMAGIFGMAFSVHLLALWLGWTLALGILFGTGALGLLLAALMLRRGAGRLVRAHREHVEQEKLAVRAAIAEAIAAGRVSAGLAGASASIAALLLLILRRAGGTRPPEDEERGPMEPPPDAPT